MEDQMTEAAPIAAPELRPAHAPTADTAAPPFLSIIVPVRNEERFLETTLRQLLSQRYPRDRYEVIVADGESTDGTREIVARLEWEHDNLKLVHNPRRLSSGGRNAGVRAACGEIILIVDGHCHIDDDRHLIRLVEAFERSGADCLGRPQPQDVSQASRLQQAIAAARGSWLGHHSASFVYSSEEQFVPPQSVAVAYRRSVFEQIGAFDETIDACEDYEFNFRVARAGLRCFFTPAIRVRYVPRGTLRGLFRQLFRYGRGRMRMLRKHRSSFSVAAFVPAAFVAGLCAGPLTAFLGTPWGLAYAAVVALYLAIVLAVSIGIAGRSRSPALLAVLPAVFVTIHVAAGAGALAELVAGKRFTRLEALEANRWAAD
jgi:succinoglycan biosynthesis protein ExoA